MIQAYSDQLIALYSQLLNSDWQIIGGIVAIEIVLGILWALLWAVKKKGIKAFLLFINLVFGTFIALEIGNFWIVYPFLFVLPPLLLGFILFQISPYSNQDQENIHTIPFQTTLQTKKFINIEEHLGVFGATGSGKTESAFVPIIKHIFKWGISSLIFDYKDFELMEKVYGIYENQRVKNLKLQENKKQTKPLPKIRTIYFLDPNYSNHINPIAPKYLERMEEVEDIANTLFDNLYPGGGKEEQFFKESGAAAFAGTVWRFKEDYPTLCTFPYVCAVIINASAEQLIYFIQKSTRAKVLASPFLDATGNKKQLASVKSSITAAIKKISTPDIFMVLKKSDFNLAINKPDNNTVLGLVNVPSRDSIYLPIMATIARMVMNQCSARDREYSIWLFDEGSALKFPKLDRVLATLRTFKILITWGLQDKVQGKILYNEDVLKAILSNLNIKLIGKANEPDSAEYYSKIFGTHNVTETSTNRGRGGASVTRRKVEKRVVKPSLFRSMKKGEFYLASANGKGKKINLKRAKYFTQPPKQINFYTRNEIERHFDDVMVKAQSILEEDTRNIAMDDLD